VERALAEIDVDDGDRGIDLHWHRVLPLLATLTSLDRWRGESTAGPSHHPIGGRRSPFAQAYIVGKR